MSVDGFFSLNAQKADIDPLPRRFRAVVRASEAMRWITDRLPPLITVADGVYIESVASP